MTRRTKRILFVGEGVTLAHVVRPLLLAQSLSESEFEVHFACAKEARSIVDLANVIGHTIDSMTPEKFLAILESGAELFSEKLLTNYVEEELELLSKLKPDLVVSDLRLSLAVSCPLQKIPLISLTNAYWSPFADRSGLPLPSYKIFERLGISKIKNPVALALIRSAFNLFLPFVYAKQARGLDNTRRHFQLPPFPDYLTGFTWGDRTCFADTPSIAPVKQLRSGDRYIGPVCWSPQQSLPDWWGRLDERLPLVVVSLGSSGPVHLAPLLIRALSQLPIQVAVATANRIPADSFPERFFVSPYLPGDLVARRATAVITNGGSPSTYQALREGAPVLGLPLNMDQLLCMSNVDRHGSGIMLRADNLEEHEIVDGIRQLIENRKYRERAVLISKEFQSLRCEQQFLQVVAEFFPVGALTQANVLRKENRYV